MSRAGFKLILLVALVVQAIGSVVLLTSDFSSQASSVAFWAVISAGIVEVTLTLVAKRKGVSING